MRSARRVGEAGTHPTPTDHVRGPTQTASSGESEGKNRVNSYMCKTALRLTNTTRLPPYLGDGWDCDPHDNPDLGHVGRSE